MENLLQSIGLPGGREASGAASVACGAYRGNGGSEKAVTTRGHSQRVGTRAHPPPRHLATPAWAASTEPHNMGTHNMAHPASYTRELFPARTRPQPCTPRDSTCSRAWPCTFRNLMFKPHTRQCSPQQAQGPMDCRHDNRRLLHPGVPSGQREGLHWGVSQLQKLLPGREPGLLTAPAPTPPGRQQALLDMRTCPSSPTGGSSHSCRAHTLSPRSYGALAVSAAREPVLQLVKLRLRE